MGKTFLLAVAAFLALYAGAASAATAPLSGYAWSENTGWVQFSCPEYLDGVQLSDILVSGYAWSENIGWLNFGGPNYQVSIDAATNGLKGNAWSETVGWFSFNRTETGDPPGEPFNTGSGPIAQYDKATGNVTGWLRALAHGGGWDGWIKLSGAGYGVIIDKFGSFTGFAWGGDVVGWLKFDARTTSCNQPYSVTFDTNTGALSGYAWSEGLGWVSFKPDSPFPVSASIKAQPAQMSFADDNFYGWARLQSAITAPLPSGNVRGFAWSENIGWVKLAGTITGAMPVSYGLKIDLNPGPNNGAVSGSAWSENMGWLSFNRSETGIPPTSPYNGPSDTVIAKYDPATGNLSGWARALNALDTPPSPPNPAPPPPNPTSQTLAPSYPITGFAWSENIGWLELNNSSLNYGVYIDAATNNLTGRAWSENIGWVSFDKSDTGVPPAPPYNGGSDTVIAKYDPATGAITGWARALTNGDTWDGWIKLNGATYGVVIDKTVGTVSGFAWGGDVVGWLKFNNALCSYCRQGTTLPTPSTPIILPDPFGSGKDGAVTISGTKNINADALANGRTVADGVAYPVTIFGLSSVSVLSGAFTPAGIAKDDEVLLINLQGSKTSNGSVGTYEFFTVSSVSGNVVNFTANITKTYGVGGNSDLTGQKIILQRVPNYTDVTVSPSGTLTANSWNGTTGGVLAFRSKGTVIVNSGGSISTSGLGYRGSPLTGSCPWPGASTNQGESYTGLGAVSAGANGGGGGSGGRGGGGGYGTAGAAGSPGAGGGTYGDSNLTKLYPGSAGAASDALDCTGWTPRNGFNGGGIVYVTAQTLSVSGAISANGATASYAYPTAAPGSGAGGSIYLIADNATLGTNLVQANGGSGSYTQAGGSGRIMAYYSSAVSGTTSPTFTQQQFQTTSSSQSVTQAWDGWIKLSGSGYGVTADQATGALNGWAWGGPILGWLQFNPPVAGQPVTGTPLSAADIIVASTPDAGWLVVGNGGAGSAQRTFGAHLNRNSCELEGYAWGGDPVGWLSFNCVNSNSCSQSKYNVRMGYPGCVVTPTASNPTLSASATVFCQAVPTFTFSWTYNSPQRPFGDSQSAYQIQIDNNADFSSPEFDTGKVLAAASTITKGIADATLVWGAANRWRVKVWNSNDKPSDWAVSADTINTPIHALPKVDFSWDPKNILPGQTVQFTSNLTLSPASSGTAYVWTFSGGGADPVQSNDQNPKVRFTQHKSTDTATFTVTDDAGQCSVIKTLQTGKPLPKYREINPGTVLEPSF